ncbi:MAG: T9SS type A sorting domain-containing protein [Psychroserpens sp.]|uniref:DUF7507 domain-containing protein n=1 Tax=Psychroserpens sp. TaxID=2020870 RepID=UPI0030018CC5
MKKDAYIILLLALISFTISNAQNTIIPDSNFEQALIDLGIDTESEINGVVLTENIESVDSLNIFNKGISDLTGIQDFSNLEVLNCANNVLTTIDISSNLLLRKLNCSSNALSILNVSINSSLEVLNCANNLITDELVVSSNTILEELDCSTNQIEIINVSANSELQILNVSDNRLTSIILNSNSLLVELNCSFNQLDALEIFDNQDLKNLLCGNNQIEVLDVSNNMDLEILDCSSNQLFSIDVSSNSALEQLICTNNQIENLIINNANNPELTLLGVSNNQLTTLDISTNANLENLTAASNQLLTVLLSPSNTLINSFDVSDNLITELDLSMINTVECPVQLDDPINIEAIKTAGVTDNAPEGIGVGDVISYTITVSNIGNDVLSNVGLVDSLTDFLGNALSLDEGPIFEDADLDSDEGTLQLGETATYTASYTLTQNDVDAGGVSNSVTVNAEMPDSSIVSDVSDDDNDFDGNTSDDPTETIITEAPSPDPCQSENASINVSGNQLSSLTIKNGFNNKYSSFNAEDNPDLFCITVDDLSVALDAVNWIKDDWAYYSDTHPCNASLNTYVPDDNFEGYLEANGMGDGILDNNFVLFANINLVTDLDLNGQGICDLTGIEDFTDLVTLDISNNDISNCPDDENGDPHTYVLDLSANIYLTSLICSGNEISVLDLSSNINLTELYANNNVLTHLDLSQNNLLTVLDISFNQITELDLSNLTVLTNLNCASNDLDFLNIDSNPGLTDLDCSANDLSILSIKNVNNAITLDTSGNTNLFCIEVDDAADAMTNWTNLDLQPDYSEDCNSSYIPDLNFENYLETHNANGDEVVDPADGLGDGIEGNHIVDKAKIEMLIDLDISGLNIESLIGISSFIALQNLNCSTNQISKLDLTNNAALITIDCSNNAIANLDLSMNSNLTELYCNDNNLEVLNIANGQNGTLLNMVTTSNPNLYCITVDNPIPDPAPDDWYKDPQTIYDLNCEGRLTDIPDSRFEVFLELNGFGDDVANNGKVFTSRIEVIQTLDINGLNISGITGILDFKALISLNCSGNNLADLDVLTLANLKILDCNSNNLTSGNLLLQNGLEQLFCAKNNLTSLDVGPFNDLKKLDCSDNFIGVLDLSMNPNLSNLYCSNNYLDALNIAANSDLVELRCDANEIDSIDFGANGLLEKINCDANGINELLNLDACLSLTTLSAVSNDIEIINLTSNTLLDTLNVSSNRFGVNGLNVDANTTLKFLAVSDNGLSDFYVDQNIALTNLNVSNNELEALDLMANSEITHLNIASNSFAAIDLASIESLEVFNGSDNQFTDLNFNDHPYLTDIESSSNQLITLKIRNGNNTELERLNTVGNPDLECIEIDVEDEIGDSWATDAETPEEEEELFKEDCRYTDTYVPDDAFELALAAFDDIADDNYVPTANIEGLTDLNLFGLGINDLTGIEDLEDLQTLDISGNNFPYHPDDLDDDPDLYILDLSFNTVLSELQVNSSNLTHLDLSQNDDLITLGAHSNNLESINLSENLQLESVDLSLNQIMTVDFSYLSSLSNFDISSNQITDLDLSSNAGLTDLNCASNGLITLNIQNGNNAELLNIDATNNPELICVEADSDSEPSGVNWQLGGASLSMDCHYYQTYVPDDAFEQILITFGYDSGELDDYVPTVGISGATNLNIISQNIMDLTGIEAFENLISLNCSSNELATLDLSANLMLENLDCSGNQLSTLEITSLTNLINLNASNNVLTNIDLSSNSSITNLDLATNDLTDLDLSSNGNLENLNCSYNQLTFELNVSQNSNLEVLDARSNQLQSIDIQNGNNGNISFFNSTDNPSLTCILVDNLSEDFSSWQVDPWSSFELECDDLDNDGVTNDEDLCPNTPFGDPVDLFGCSYFILPADNFNVLITDENCISSNNGSISISATELHNYIATVSGENYFHTFNFTNNGLNILNLHAGNYEVCITVDGAPDFIICYNVIITEPEALEVSRSIDYVNETVSFELSGGLNYIINFNGLEFNTSEHEITFGLMSGINTITIRTDLECQGVYTKRIYNSNELYVYPNPFEDQINVLNGFPELAKIDISIYSASGQLVFEKTIINEDGFLSFNTSSLSSGFYLVTLKSDTELTTFKIVKK